MVLVYIYLHVHNIYIIRELYRVLFIRVITINN